MKKWCLFFILNFCLLNAAQELPDFQQTLNTILTGAVDKNDAPTVVKVLELGADPNARVEGVTSSWAWILNGNAVLGLASFFGYAKIVDLLIKAGADVNAVDPEQVAPLIMASRKSQLHVVKLLLDAGAEVNQKDKWGQTAFDYALETRAQRVMDLLEEAIVFLRNPLFKTKTNPDKAGQYLTWSIAYKKDDALAYLLKKNPNNILDDTAFVAKNFLIAARLGNELAFKELYKILRDQKRPGLHAIFLTASSYLIAFHPELSYLTHQMFAEEIVPQSCYSISSSLNLRIFLGRFSKMFHPLIVFVHLDSLHEYSFLIAAAF